MDIKRYKITASDWEEVDVILDEDGNHCEYSDVAPIIAERDNYKKRLDDMCNEYEKLACKKKAEVDEWKARCDAGNECVKSMSLQVNKYCADRDRLIKLLSELRNNVYEHSVWKIDAALEEVK